MKGQLIPFAFVVLLVGGILIYYVFYSTFYGTKYQFNVFQARVIDVVRNLIESFKNYLKLSLTYSSHQALREHACLGGLVTAGPWICNGPTPVTVGESKGCLEKYTKYYLNVYSDLFNTSLPVDLSKNNSTSCVYDVDEGGVLSGKYDEGNFAVNCSGAKISISGTDISEFEKIDTKDFITRNRYWYMFRIFYEWAMDDPYSPCICGCCLACADCDCADNCAKRALDNLQKRFDKSVECKVDYEGKCCDHEYGGISFFYRQECLPWPEAKCKCKEHECLEPPIGGKVCVPELTSPSLKASQEYENQSNFSSPSSFSESLILFYIENRLASNHHFICTDYKYYVPSSPGPIPLTFDVTATGFYRCPDVCGPYAY